MKEKTIVSTMTLLSSLASYYYAKEADKDVVPYMLVGGFIGAMIGEVIFEKIKSTKDADRNRK